MSRTDPSRSMTPSSSTSLGRLSPATSGGMIGSTWWINLPPVMLAATSAVSRNFSVSAALVTGPVVKEPLIDVPAATGGFGSAALVVDAAAAGASVNESVAARAVAPGRVEVGPVPAGPIVAGPIIEPLPGRARYTTLPFS